MKKISPRLHSDLVASRQTVEAPPAYIEDRGEPLAIVARDETELIVAVAIRPYKLRLLPWAGASIAVVGPLQALAGTIETREQREIAYRAILDVLAYWASRPHNVRFLLPPAFQDDVDLIWRSSAAMGGTCLISEANQELSADVRLPGARAALGSIIGELLELRPWRLLSSRLRGMSSRPRRTGREERFGLFTRDLANAPAGGFHPPVDVHFALVPTNEVLRRPGRYGLSLIGAATASSIRCYGGWVGEELVCRLHASDLPSGGWGEHAAAMAAVPRPAAMITGAFTIPEQRGRSIYPAALIWVADEHRRAGYRTLCLSANVANRSAVRGAEKAGFRRVD